MAHRTIPSRLFGSSNSQQRKRRQVLRRLLVEQLEDRKLLSATHPLPLSSLNGTNGFRLDGVAAFDFSGFSISNAGDVNGDGFDDLVVGAYGADPNGATSGSSYVVFGKSGGFSTTINLSALNGTNGFRLDGVAAGDESGRSGVSSAGDVNGDGFNDLVIGAFGADPNGTYSGSSYVLFGKSVGFAATINLSTLNGTDGFRLDGVNTYDQSGRSVSSAGDVNGDGFDDLVVGARGADPNGTYSGSSYVVFGGNFTGGAETQVGGDGGQTLSANQGQAVVDRLIGGRGNDTLISDGGPDILIGGQGDDTLAIPDVDFSSTRRLLGGNGSDTLLVNGAGLTLDLTSINDNRIQDIEVIDLTGTGDNTLIIDVTEVLNISSHSNTLTVLRNVGDVVVKGNGWTQLADESIGGDTFEVFRQGAAVLKVHRLEHTFMVTSGNGADIWSLRCSGTDVELFNDNSSTLVDSIRLPLLGSIKVRAAAGEANRLDVNYSFGGFFNVPGGITFEGSSGTDDLRIIGSGLNVATFVSSGPSMASGSLIVSEGGPGSTIQFSAIEPLTLTGLLAMNVSGILGVGAQTLSIEAATFTELGSATILTGGTINAAGGLHLAASSLMQASGTINAPVTSEIGSTITMTGDLSMGDAASFDGIHLAGRLNIGANTLTLLDGHKAVLGSQTTLGSGVAGGTLNSASGIELPDTQTFVGRGTVNTVNGEFENQGFVQGNSPGLTFNHLVTGAGDFGGTVNFLGGTDFGNSPAKINVDTITFGPLNTHLVEIGGLVAGSEFDQVNASATVHLSGTLEVAFLSLGNGYAPSAGQSFDIINAASRVGTFTNTVLPALPTGLQWQVEYLATGVVLNIVQIPASIVGRYVYHKGSSFAGGGVASALDTGKVLAKEGVDPQTLGYNNLINTSRGINGLVFDISNLPGTPTADDFQFQMSPQGAFNEGLNPPGGWGLAPSPSLVHVTPGSPARIRIEWPDNAIANRWLRVTVKASTNTGLAESEVYYLGHLRGETTGPSGSVFTVSFADISPIRGAVGSTVNVSSTVDIDKNGTVAFADISSMRPSVGAQLTIITIPAAGGGGGGSLSSMIGDDGQPGGRGETDKSDSLSVDKWHSSRTLQSAAYAAAVDSAMHEIYSSNKRRWK